ncbi:MAG: AMP-binding protein, partial [Deltaproteobacteria bacterium]|nr:AMP-binding protein [Deltaproteobacteria bacterium]
MEPLVKKPGWETLPKALRDRASLTGGEIAVRVKDRGIWKAYTWKDYYENVRNLCLGMVSLGLGRGDKVSIVGENKPEWFWAELAAQCAGGVAVGIYTDCSAEEVKYFLENSDSSFVVAHDQEQVDKLLWIRDQLPLLKKIIYWDTKGLWGYDRPDLVSMQEVIELGQAFGEENPRLFDEMIDQGSADDIAVL